MLSLCACSDKQRVVYTSPLKALSNQKFRELKEEFDDVGLMTGDITINPQATCVVMTTEILRSMLYRGDELLQSMKWVIFDEIHYMRDKERGVVWEESMIFCPPRAFHISLMYWDSIDPLRFQIVQSRYNCRCSHGVSVCDPSKCE